MPEVQRRNWRWRWLIPVVIGALLVAAVGGCGSKAPTPKPSDAKTQEDPAAFFKGKNLEFIVPYSVGGGFDKWARLLAPMYEKYIPGVTVVVKNVPGAGSLVGTNQLYQAKPDGLTIGIVNMPGLVYNKIMGEPNAKFDLNQFTYLGRVSAESRAVIIGKNSSYKTMADLAKAGRPISVAFTGKGSDDYFNMYVEAAAFGFKIKPVTGYSGGRETSLAVARGDVELTQNTASNAVSIVTTGEAKVLAQVASQKDPLLGPDVPLALDQVGAEGKPLLDTAIKLMELDRVIVAPPGVPEERAKVLAGVMQKAFQNQEFVNLLKQSKLPYAYLSGDQTHKMVTGVMANSDKVGAIVKEALK